MVHVSVQLAIMIMGHHVALAVIIAHHVQQDHQRAQLVLPGIFKAMEIAFVLQEPMIKVLPVYPVVLIVHHVRQGLLPVLFASQVSR